MAEIKDIIWTDKSKNDLKTIYEFISYTINEKKAFDTISNIIEKVEILYKTPKVGQREPKFEELKKEYRRLIEQHCKIVYHIMEDTVYINRVFDSRQNPGKLTIK